MQRTPVRRFARLVKRAKYRDAALDLPHQSIQLFYRRSIQFCLNELRIFLSNILQIKCCAQLHI